MTTSVRGVALALVREHLAAGRTLRVPLAGASMWPALRDGQVVPLSPCDPAALRVGDVVLVDRGDRLVLHRVVRLTPGGPLLRGDARRRSDGVVPATAVLARLRRRRLDPLRAALTPLAWPLRSLGARLSRRFWDRPGPRRGL